MLRLHPFIWLFATICGLKARLGKKCAAGKKVHNIIYNIYIYTLHLPEISSGKHIALSFASATKQEMLLEEAVCEHEQICEL